MRVEAMEVAMVEELKKIIYARITREVSKGV